MYDINISDDSIHRHLEINTDNPNSFVETLKQYEHYKVEYQRAFAQAQKDVDILQFKLETALAEIVEELKVGKKGGKPVPASGWGELRRVDALLNPRYQELRSKLIEAVERLNILRGFVETMESRGYRFVEIAKLQERLMGSGVRVYEDRLDTSGANLKTE
jgi:hypothetical protein